MSAEGGALRLLRCKSLSSLSGTESLAARFAAMEHFKSTIATTAIAAFGLVAAAHILHPGNFERTTYPSRPVATVASHAAAWVNPPAMLPVAQEVREVAAKADTAPAQPAPVPVAWTSARAEAPAKTAEASPDHRHKAAHRRRVAQRKTDVRQASLDRPAQPAVAPAAPEKPKADRIDPIGDIIRGLGFGRDS